MPKKELFESKSGTVTTESIPDCNSISIRIFSLWKSMPKKNYSDPVHGQYRFDCGIRHIRNMSKDILDPINYNGIGG
jgi:hypothetical protein